MTLVGAESTASQWDPPMFHLARWLTRHLDDPALVIWISKHGAQLHPQFASLVDDRLNELTRLEQAGEAEELQRIQVAAPRAIPRPLLRVVWRLLILNRVKSPSREFDLYGWLKRFLRDGLTPSLRLSLQELLTPCIELR